MVHRSKALLPKICCVAGQQSRCRLRRRLTTLRALCECQNHSILIRTDDHQTSVLWGAPSELEPLVSPPCCKAIGLFLLNPARIWRVCEASCQGLHFLWQGSWLGPELQSGAQKLRVNAAAVSRVVHLKAMCPECNGHRSPNTPALHAPWGDRYTQSGPRCCVL